MEQEAIGLGERRFFERATVLQRRASCSRCHLPERNCTDGEARARGLALTDRNTPSLANVRLARWFGWDGAHDSLWSQGIRPILDAKEMGSSAARVAKLMREDPDLSCRHRKIFGTPSPDDEKVLVDVAKALAAFQETLVSGRTAFDEFRDALVTGDKAGIAKYPEPAQRGDRTVRGRRSQPCLARRGCEIRQHQPPSTPRTPRPEWSLISQQITLGVLHALAVKFPDQG